MKYKILKLVFIAWVAMWLLFTIRGPFVKGYVSEYRQLLSRSLEGKRSFMTGDRIYEFIVFCGKNMPQGSSYEIIGMEKKDIDPIEKRRAVYYLYPNMEAKNPDFILVYDEPGFAKAGYAVFLRLDGTRYILKRQVR